MDKDDSKITVNLSNDVDYEYVGGMTITPTYCTADITDTGSEYSYNTTYSSTAGYSVTLDGIDGIDTELHDTWPAEYRVKEMIEKYPALKIQYEKFIEIYNLIKDDHKDDLDDILK